MLAPALRDDLGLTLPQVGVVIAAPWVGPILTLLPWGLLADQIGERRVLAFGLGLCGAFAVALAFTTAFAAVVALLALAGAAGASVNSASGRAVMSWFDVRERGLALGIRQGSTPLGGVISALVLPAIERVAGLEGAFLFLGALVLAAAAAGGAVLRDAPPREEIEHAAPAVLRDARLWWLAGSGALYLVAQIAVMGFVVLYLHDERGLSPQAAAAALAAMQAIAIPLRIVVGRWSDVVADRIAPLRLLGLASFAALAATAAVLVGGDVLVVGAFVVSGSLAMSWNGLAFAGAAELAGRRRSGAALGFQQTVLSATAALVSPAFAAAVEASSWRVAFFGASLFPLVGWLTLGRVRV